MSVELINYLQDCNDYSFKNQVLRAAISIPSNIAEGSERQTQKEFRYFLNVAKGSAAELRTQLYIGIETGIIETELGKRLIEELKELSSMMQGLIKSLDQKLNT